MPVSLVLKPGHTHQWLCSLHGPKAQGEVCIYRPLSKMHLSLWKNLSLCRNAGMQKRKGTIWRRKANCYTFLYCSTVFRKYFEHFNTINKRNRANRLPWTSVMKREIVSRSHIPGGWTHQMSAWHDDISAVGCNCLRQECFLQRKHHPGESVPHLSRNYSA